MKGKNPLGMRVAIYLGIWLAVAITVGATGILPHLPRPALQGIIAALTCVLLSCWRSPEFRAWFRRVPIRVVISLHLTRFVGLYFLYLYSRGELPFAFAVPGGCGDVIVALGVILLSATSLHTSRLAVFAWNVLGFADILMVVVTAGRIGLSAPESMVALAHLPLSLLPTFVVPLIIASHILIFVRLRGPQWQAGSALVEGPATPAVG